MTHSGSLPCSGCERKLEECDPRIVECFRVIQKGFPNAHISWGFRDQKTQDEFFKDGRSRQRWPESPHNETKDGKPFSRAIDLFEYVPHAPARFLDSWYTRIYEFCMEQQLKMKWGGRFVHLHDANHFYVE
jgi:hypothetical protein